MWVILVSYRRVQVSRVDFGDALQQILTAVMMHIVVNKSTDKDKPHLICFFFYNCTISLAKKMFFFFRVQAVKALRDTLTWLVLSLNNNSKLTNQIAGLVATEVK